MKSKWQYSHFRFVTVFAVLFCLFAPVMNIHAAPKSSSPIVVAYPEVREPYNQIFNALREGVAAESQHKVLEYSLKEDATVQAFKKWLDKKQAVGIIALGNRGSNLIREIAGDVDIPLVIGGTFIDGSLETDRLSGISMAPSPELLFLHQLKLFPATRKIHVVYESEHLWLIARAKASAEKLGIQLNAVPAGNIRELAGAYQEILAAQASETEALWLPYSGKSLEKALLNEVLEKAWSRDLSVFSSNLADVSKGILFSMYPHNERNGRRLVELLQWRITGNNEQGAEVLLSRDLNVALNTRTADHLKVRLGTEEKNAYEILFPLKR